MEFLNAMAILANYVIVPGLAYGSQLALGALGVTLVYGVLRFSNFAHGETMSMGAMFAILFLWLFKSMGVSIAPLPTVLLALVPAIICAAVYILITDRVVYRFYRIQKAVPTILVVVSTGIMFVTNGLIRFVIGPDDRSIGDGARFVMKAREFKNWTGLDVGIAIKTSQVITVITAVVLVVALFWFLEKTKTGKSMRAYADNENLALLSGIDPEKVVRITWLLVAVLATVAGTLYGLDKSYKPFTFLQLLLPIFASAIIGGIGSPLGAIVGGFIVAFSEILITFAFKGFFTRLVPDDFAPEGLVQLLSTDYKFAVSFAILVIVLIIMPTGIFKGRTL